jgi:uncharacterized protein (DUF1800 family)
MLLENQTLPAGKPLDPDWAWAPYQPDAKRPWNLLRAGHLFRRAGFGATWPELATALRDGPQKTLDRLLHAPADAEAFNRQLDQDESAATSPEGLRAWWLRRIIQTPYPLLEKMTLFWHGHLATSNARVGNAVLMMRHVQLLRKHALGRFDLLLQEVSRDPAMLVWLQSGANRKARPTDHYARALLEQFTLGPGNFCEEDVREAARAFTGWFVLRDEVRYIPREHDEGTKRLLGRQGDFGAEDVVRIALGHPAAPRLLARKLYRWLVSETSEPGDALIAPLAASLGKDYNVARAVETILRSNLFFSAAAYRRRIKGPVEYALGIVRPLEGLVPTELLGSQLAGLGQDVFEPPTTQGWPGGRHWINQATLLGRAALARELLAAGGPYDGRLDPATLAARHGQTAPPDAAKMFLDLFLQGDVPDAVRTKLLTEVPQSTGGEMAAWLRRFVRELVMLPEFQLA